MTQILFPSSIASLDHLIRIQYPPGDGWELSAWRPRFRRWGEYPPSHSDTSSRDQSAWAAIGEILFWSLKDGGPGASATQIEERWSFVTREVPLAFPDIRYNLAHSQWRGSGDLLDLVGMFPQQIRLLLEEAIRQRHRLTSVFRCGGSRDRSVLRNALYALERVGNAESISVLSEITEDAEFGKTP